MNSSQHFIFQVPLSRSKLNFFLNDALGDKLETVAQMIVIFCHITSHPHFDICREIITASRVHDGYAYLKDKKPDNRNENDNTKNVWAKHKSENKNYKKGQEW